MMARIETKFQGYLRTRALLLSHPEGVQFGAIVAINDGRESTTWRYLKEMNARLIERGLYTLDPAEADIALARAVLRRAGELS